MSGNVSFARSLLLLADLVGSPLCCMAELALWAQLAFQILRRHVVCVPGLQNKADRDVPGIDPIPLRPIQSGRIVCHQRRPQLLSKGLVQDRAHILRTTQAVREQQPHCLTTFPSEAVALTSAHISAYAVHAA